MEWEVKVVILLKKGQHCDFPNTITIECYGIISFFVALLELHWIYYLTKFGCWMRLPCHRELRGNVGNFWISMHISDIHGYLWISMDFHRFP